MPKAAVKGSKYLCGNMTFAAREAIKKLRTNTMIALPDSEGCKIIGITSTQPGEGKSSTITNLAYSFAGIGNKVLLLDADLRRPSIAEKLTLQTSVGLGALLTDNNNISEAIQHYADSDGKNGFDVICGSGYHEDASELLLSKRFSALLERLKEAYDYILVDIPPVDAVIDAVAVGKHTDGMIVVIRENKIPKKQFDRCISQLEYAGIKVLGIVINGSVEGTGKKPYDTYKYY